MSSNEPGENTAKVSPLIFSLCVHRPGDTRRATIRTPLSQAKPTKVNGSLYSLFTFPLYPAIVLIGMYTPQKVQRQCNSIRERVLLQLVWAGSPPSSWFGVPTGCLAERCVSFDSFPLALYSRPSAHRRALAGLHTGACQPKSCSQRRSFKYGRTRFGSA